VLRLLSRRRCLSCGDELPPPREYPMRVCATCILAPAGPRRERSAGLTVPRPDSGWRDGDDCA